MKEYKQMINLFKNIKIDKEIPKKYIYPQKKDRKLLVI